MATTTTKPDHDVTTAFTGVSGGVSAGISPPAWPRQQDNSTASDCSAQDPEKPSQRDALQALLAFSALHDQVRRRKALAARSNGRNIGFDSGTPVVAPVAEFEQDEQFI